MRRYRHGDPPRMSSSVDLTSRIGNVVLPNPILTAAGTSGYSTELSEYIDLSRLGAVVVKSLRIEDWPGNPAPRLAPVGQGLLNSVGLEGPSLKTWIDQHLPRLRETGARVVLSVWGRTVAEFAQAGQLLAEPPDGLLALEVNVSCPNVEDRSSMFAHSAKATAEVVSAMRACSLPLWVKLSPNVPNLVDIALAAVEAGADALVLINTVLGMKIDIENRRPVLGGKGGGLSGPPIHPVAVRSVYDCYRALPEVPIVGVGGVMHGRDAIELMMAGAAAVQVGTASFLDPRATVKVLDEIEEWCATHGVDRVAELIGAAHSSDDQDDLHDVAADVP